jgi:hypothetical protein
MRLGGARRAAGRRPAAAPVQAAEEHAVGPAEGRLCPAPAAAAAGRGGMAAAAVLEVDVVGQPVRRAENRPAGIRAQASFSVGWDAAAARAAAEGVFEVDVRRPAVRGAVEQAAVC